MLPAALPVVSPVPGARGGRPWLSPEPQHCGHLSRELAEQRLSWWWSLALRGESRHGGLDQTERLSGGSSQGGEGTMRSRSHGQPRCRQEPQDAGVIRRPGRPSGAGGTGPVTLEGVIEGAGTPTPDQGWARKRLLRRSQIPQMQNFWEEWEQLGLGRGAVAMMALAGDRLPHSAPCPAQALVHPPGPRKSPPLLMGLLATRASGPLSWV